MAGNGPPPAEKRRRTNADTYADVQATLIDEMELRGPALVGSFLPQTREWYDCWRYAPQAAAFILTDWQRLKLLAPLVNRYFERPNHLLLGEIRQNESLLGATYVDRLKARMKVEKTEPSATPVGVTALDDYRNRLSG